MSPRSAEFMVKARDRLAAARDNQLSHPEVSVSAAYYAMLYAARAALSEEDRYAKTHAGVWSLFSELFVRQGRFDQALYDSADTARDRREKGDYEALTIAPELAGTLAAAAEDFVAAIDEMLAA